jgi:hypothetical protein
MIGWLYFRNPQTFPKHAKSRIKLSFTAGKMMLEPYSNSLSNNAGKVLLLFFVTGLSWLYKFIVMVRIDIVKNNFVIVLLFDKY